MKNKESSGNLSTNPDLLFLSGAPAPPFSLPFPALWGRVWKKRRGYTCLQLPIESTFFLRTSSNQMQCIFQILLMHINFILPCKALVKSCTPHIRSLDTALSICCSHCISNPICSQNIANLRLPFHALCKQQFSPVENRQHFPQPLSLFFILPYPPPKEKAIFHRFDRKWLFLLIPQNAARLHKADFYISGHNPDHTPPRRHRES